MAARGSNQSTTSKAKGPARVFYGWWVLAASCVVMGFSSGIITYSATVFFNPVSRTLALSRTATSLAIALARAENSLLAPVVGYFIDRFGPRVPIFVGMVLTAVGLICFGLFTNSLLLFVLTWTLMVSLGTTIGGFAPNWAAINNWFVRKKGQAMGFGMAAQAMGGVVLAPLLAFIIVHWGWRTGAVATGLGVLFIVLPVVRVIRTRPESMGLRPDGDEPSATLDPSPPPATSPQESAVRVTDAIVNFTVGQAARTTSLKIFVLALGLRQFAAAGLILHLSPLIQDRGYGELMAGGMVGLVALMGAVGAVTAGWVSDRLPRRQVMATIVAVESLALLVLLLATHSWQVYIFIVGYGFGQGAHALNRAILGEYFGQSHYGKIWGIISMSTTPLAALGPVYAGWLIDSTQSYSGVIITFIAVYAASAVAYANCRRP